MSTIVTRAGKGSPLTNTELDANFTNLNTDKWETGRGTYTASGAASAASWLVAGIGLSFLAATYTDSSAAGTVATGHVHAFGTPTIASTNARTITDSATVYIHSAPAAAASVTITRGWAAYIASGNVYLGNGFVGVNATAAVGSEKLRVNGAGYFDGSLQTVGMAGIGIAPGTDRVLQMGTPTSSATTLYGSVLIPTSPATNTAAFTGYYSGIASTATAYTLSALVHFSAAYTTKGAGSTITSVYGFAVANAVATGTNNYGFHSAINSATTTWQLYMGGTAFSYFGGPVSVIGAASSVVLMYVGATGAHPGTTAQVYGTATDFIAASTTTTSATGFYSTLRTAVASFTCTQLIHYDAAQSIKGAGSSITNIYGFYARNALALSGSNNYGFYSDIASAATTWQLFVGGSAQNYFGGPVGILTPDPLGNGCMLYLGGLATHPSSTTTVYGALVDYTSAATATAITVGFHSVLRTTNSAYTTNVYHFRAGNTVKGAASTITNSIGFYASNQIATGTNNYGFYSDINSASSTWQSFFGGTANNHINGNLSFGTTTLAGTSGDKVIVMANGTAPSTSPAGVGQLYVESGALKFRGSSGTVTTVAPA